MSLISLWQKCVTNGLETKTPFTAAARMLAGLSEKVILDQRNIVMNHFARARGHWKLTEMLLKKNKHV